MKAEEERVKESVDAAKCLVMDVKVVRALKTLYGVCEELDDPTPIYKAIYGAYVAKAMNAMVIREGVDGVCGIYRLRNKISGLSYVGQSVNIGNRWKEHAKRGSGADG